MIAALARAQEPWDLVWGDEFDGDRGGAPNLSNWTFDVGGGGWGNRELQTYTDSRINSFLDGNGFLAIRAVRGQDGKYTSARLKSLGRIEFSYGRIEARIRVPSGQGIWPAFWMLGTDIERAGWPECGEIDIMESIGREPSRVYGGVHGPGYSGGNSLTGQIVLPAGERLADRFRVFSAVWTPDRVEFYLDSTLFHRVSLADVGSERWRFQKPFFILLNVAVGGDWPGAPDGTTSFPQDMLIDYVRIYQRAGTARPRISPVGALNSASFNGLLAPGSLATLFGSELAGHFRASLFDARSNAFPSASGSTKVLVGGIPAPLVFVSPEQINFQVPWATTVDHPVSIVLLRDGVESNILIFTPRDTAPGVFAQRGTAILTCLGPERPGSACSLWGTGFGPKAVPQRDGTPSDVSRASENIRDCALKIAGVMAAVTYCGAAPGLIIDQLNFIYPSINALPKSSFLPATLIVGGNTTEILVPLRP